MESLFSNMFDELGESLKSVLDGFSEKFNTSMATMMENFTASFSETFAKMMEGFSQDFSTQLATALGVEIDEILNSGIMTDFTLELEAKLDEFLSQYIMISCIPVVLSIFAVIISIATLRKIKTAALFDKRFEVYYALEFLFNFKKLSNIKENPILLDKLEDNMTAISKAKFIFDENLTKSIKDISDEIYSLVIAENDLSNNSLINEKVAEFNTNTLPKIEKLIKL